MCWINLVAKVAYMLWAPSFQGPRSPWVSTFSCWRPFFSFFFFFFCLSIFSPQGRMQDLPNGGGGVPLQALAPGRWRPSLRHCSEASRPFRSESNLAWHRPMNPYIGRRDYIIYTEARKRKLCNDEFGLREKICKFKCRLIPWSPNIGKWRDNGRS